MIAYGSRCCSTFCRWGAPAGRYSGVVKVEGASVLSPKFVEGFSASADGRQPVARGASRGAATAHTTFYSLFPARWGRGQSERASRRAHDSRRVLDFAPAKPGRLIPRIPATSHKGIATQCRIIRTNPVCY
jgi:hypothetical protein